MEASDSQEFSQSKSSSIDEAEVALWGAFKTNASHGARQKLFDIYCVFARQIAGKYFLDKKSGDIEFSDLCQLAYAGLLESIDKYEPSTNVPFRAYARKRISGSILNGIVHMSERREQLSFKQRVLKERLKSLKAEKPDKLDIAEAMDVLAEMAIGLAIGYLMEDSGHYIKHDAVDPGFSPYQSLEWKELALLVRGEVSQLPKQEGLVMRYHYLDGLSFEFVAKALGLSKGRVSQIHKSALISLRSLLSKNGKFNIEK